MLERVPLASSAHCVEGYIRDNETRDLPVKIWISTLLQLPCLPLSLTRRGTTVQLHVSDETRTRYYFRTANIP
jgi:hypothetical protein